MQRARIRTAALTFAFASIVALTAQERSARGLSIYFIDVEGGQSTLAVLPSGRSLLIDAGYPGERDTNRILAAARDAGVQSIDYFLLTHFHQDHAGGVAALARRIPIRTFVDYGAPVEKTADVQAVFRAYDAVRGKRRQIHPRPGDRLPIDDDVDIVVASADGKTLSAPLPGAGTSNSACVGYVKQADDPGENARSLGIWLRYGAFRFLDLGDLNWNKLGQLVCPNNLLGTIDAYLVPHHGHTDTNIPALLAALQPRVAILNNGVTKGGYADAFASLHRQPGLDDVWQLHRSSNTGANNFSDDVIANVDGGQTSFWLKLTANRDGSFTVANSRNGVTRTYSKNLRD